MLSSDQQNGMRYVSGLDSSRRTLPKNPATSGLDERPKECGSKHPDDQDSDQSNGGKMDTNSPDMSDAPMVGVVGSPEIYGGGDGRDSGVGTSHDERVIERCDQMSHSREVVQLTPDQMRTQQCSGERHEMLGQPGEAMTISGIEASRPVKKRYNPQQSEPEQRFIPPLPQIQLQHPAPVIELPFPTGAHFQHSMNQWDWASVDNIKIPVILRGNEKYAAVHIIQLKLLSKFPPIYPPESKNPPMTSHKMSIVESWIFNSINAVICKFDFGYQLFTTDDEIVRLVEADRFYWCVKIFNLRRMIDMYTRQMNMIKSSHLHATITRVKDYVEADLQNAEKEYQRAQAFIAQANGQGSMLPRGLQRNN